MSATSEGQHLHRLLYTFERLSAGLIARGASKAAADRHALLATLRLEGWPQSEAEEFAEKRLKHH